MPKKKQQQGKAKVTPRKSPRTQEDVIEQKEQSPQENSPNPANSTDERLEQLPPEINKLKLCKPLKDLAVAIQQLDRGKLLKNKTVIENFSDAQQIFGGWLTPQKSSENIVLSKKRKRSGNVPNGEEGTKTTEETIKRLESEVEVAKSVLNKNVTESKETEKRLKDELEKCKRDLEKEVCAHRNTKDEEKVIKAELQKTSEELLYEKDTLHNKLMALEAELKECQEQIQSKNEDLEGLGTELIKRSDYIKKQRDEINSLTQECNRLHSELGTKSEEINDLRNRFSSLSASKLDGDPNITDLGDPNRPLNLVTKYQHLYDEMWTDTFDELIDSYTDLNVNSEKEKKAATELLSIFKDVLSFCKNKITDQEKIIVSTIMCCSKDDVDVDDCCIDISTIRNIRKVNVKAILPSVLKMYLEESTHDLTGSLEDFIKECVEVCWLSLVQDPPMSYEFDYEHGSSFDKDLMRDFTVSGDIVDFVVWPTLRLHKDGPIMSKGVVQPIKNS